MKTGLFFFFFFVLFRCLVFIEHKLLQKSFEAKKLLRSLETERSSRNPRFGYTPESPTTPISRVNATFLFFWDNLPLPAQQQSLSSTRPSPHSKVSQNPDQGLCRVLSLIFLFADLGKCVTKKVNKIFMKLLSVRFYHDGAQSKDRSRKSQQGTLTLITKG